MSLSIKNYSQKPDQVKLTTLKLYQWAVNNNLKSVSFVIADQFYYKKTLQQRKDILNAPSIHYLCKTIIFENRDYDQKFKSQFYPKFITVMVQYIRKINTEKLNKQMRLYQQKNDPNNKASKQYFNYRLTDQTISKQLSGYDHNGVVPVLMNQKIPIIFSDQITKLTPKFFWMGGGHPWTKMRISFEQFKKTYPQKVFVLSITYQNELILNDNDETQ